MNYEIKQINIDDINSDFRKYKISRNYCHENLTVSIRKYGIINPVYLLKSSSGFNAVSGHNRIECARNSGFKTIPAFIDNSLDSDFFLKQCLIKIYNNEIGPAGKIKLIKILSEDLQFSMEKIEDLCSDFLIPSDYSKHETVQKFISLQQALLDYIDLRDVQFKIIDKILRLEKKTADMLSLWADKTKMKFNLFKSIVEMMFDLQRKGIDTEEFNKISPENYDDRNTGENIIHDRIFALRYPLYNEMLEKSDKIRSSMAGNKIIAEVPKYFEGGMFYIKIPVDTKSGYAGLKNKFDLIKKNDIDEIVKLL